MRRPRRAAGVFHDACGPGSARAPKRQARAWGRLTRGRYAPHAPAWGHHAADRLLHRFRHVLVVQAAPRGRVPLAPGVVFGWLTPGDTAATHTAPGPPAFPCAPQACWGCNRRSRRVWMALPAWQCLSIWATALPPHPMEVASLDTAATVALPPGRLKRQASASVRAAVAAVAGKSQVRLGQCRAPRHPGCECDATRATRQARAVCVGHRRKCRAHSRWGICSLLAFPGLPPGPVPAR